MTDPQPRSSTEAGQPHPETPPASGSRTDGSSPDSGQPQPMDEPDQ